ncbi:AI-2E family transporter [Methylobacter sp. sgz302048]|uniref:AI-2E family transporter n=1 Tax=Methylobacter sp. sgz302048 TaxID=3455945 RepID=UPI003FA149DA
MNSGDEARIPESQATDNKAAAAARSTSGFLTRRTLIIAAVGAAVVALLLMLWQVAQILLLVFASLLLALFLRTLADFISRRTPLSEGWSLTLVVAVLLGLFALILALYGPKLADGFYRLFKELPSAPERLRRALEQYEWGPAFMDTLSRAGSSMTDSKQLAKIAGIFSTAFGALGSAVVVIVLGLYFAADPKTYIDGTAHLFPQARRERVYEAFDRLGHTLRWWLLGRIAAMLIVGVMIGIGLAVLGVPFAFILGLVAAILDFVPNIGPLIAAIPALMVGLSQDGTTVLYIALLYFVVQSLEGYLITPFIEQRVVDLPPALLLIAQLVLGAGFGILGLLLASPLAVVIMVLVQMLYMRDVLGEPVKLP